MRISCVVPIALLATAVTPAWAQAKTGRIAVGADSIAYAERGRGPALVLANGGAMGYGQWDDVARILGRFYRVIQFDYRGWGGSTSPTAPYSDFEDIGTLLNALHVERAYLVGCSFGGGVALDFALSHPDRVIALGLVGSVVGGFAWSESFVTREQRNAQGSMPEVIEHLFADPYFIPTAGRNLAVTRRATALLQANLPKLAHFDGRLIRPLDPPAIRRLEQLPTPTLVVVSGGEHPDVVQIADTLVSRIRGAKRVTIRAVGHMAAIEAPDRLARELRAFFTAHRE